MGPFANEEEFNRTYQDSHNLDDFGPNLGKFGRVIERLEEVMGTDRAAALTIAFDLVNLRCRDIFSWGDIADFYKYRGL